MKDNEREKGAEPGKEGGLASGANGKSSREAPSKELSSVVAKEEKPHSSLEEEEDTAGPITLDRYLHRKGQSYLSWVHLTTLIFMLVTLVLLFLYKDRCGQFISNFVFMGTSKSGSPPAVHYLENAPTPAVRANDRGAE